MTTFTFHQQQWYWNPFWGFFVLPVGGRRKKERVIKEDHHLYPTLRQAANYP
jgi:hypothetical protein